MEKIYEENYELTKWQKDSLSYAVPFKFFCRIKEEGFSTGYSTCKEVYLGSRYNYGINHMHSYQLFFDVELFEKATKIWESFSLPKFEYDLNDRINSFVRVKESAFKKLSYADVLITLVKSINNSGADIFAKMGLNHYGTFIQSRADCYKYFLENPENLEQVLDIQLCSSGGQLDDYGYCGLHHWYCRKFNV